MTQTGEPRRSLLTQKTAMPESKRSPRTVKTATARPTRSPLMGQSPTLWDPGFPTTPKTQTPLMTPSKATAWT